jgi:hypothetical protein
MDCSYFRERINLYIDGEMGYLEVAELQAHLSFCPDCAAELAQVGEVRGALAAWGGGGGGPPPTPIRSPPCRSKLPGSEIS